MHSVYREQGKPTINPDKCTQCGMCVRICGAEVLVKEDDKISVNHDTLLGCIACGHCMMVCPENAITVTGRGVTPDDIVPLPDPDKKANADQLAALMLSRRSVRHFTDRDVPPPLLDHIVDMASTAPMGIPPWDIGCVTINGKEKVQELAAEIIKGYEGFLKMFKPWVLKIMRPFIGKAKYDMFLHFVRPLATKYIEGHRKGGDELFYHAPALIIFHHSSYAEHADAAIACTYAMLAAESLGLGNCVIGGAGPIIQRNKELCEKLGIPAGHTPSLALILGYPATSFRRAIKRRFVNVNNV
jgi:nitroreductase/ferredoxin